MEEEKIEEQLNISDVETENVLNEDESILEESGDDVLSFKLENFEGPLDLLLHLIKQSKMEIETVELSKITEQYLGIS